MADVSAPLPTRPRLADHVLVRRHLVTPEAGGEAVETIVLHDTRTAELLRFSARVLGLLTQADGTRDIDGIALAAARAGVLHRRNELRQLLEELHGRGLLVDGIDAPVPVADAPAPPDRPVRALPDFSLQCDGSGTCCRQYSSIAFTDEEARRARTFVPILRGGSLPPERVFLPLAGLTPPGPEPHAHAVAMIDGACAYLGDEGRCAIHAAGGLEAKPRPCAIYPATFVDDGAAVRVSIKVECVCVANSLDAGGASGAAPLVSAEVRRVADLDPAVSVRVLPAQIAIDRAGAFLTRVAYVAWADGFFPRIPGVPDIARTFVSEAAALGAGTATDLLPLVDAFHARASAAAATADEWRGSRDAARIGRRRVATAAKVLLDRLHAAPDDLPRCTDPALETLYARATIFGHHLVGEGSRTLVDALRDRAVRILVARAMPPSGRRDSLPLVEAMTRGHGLDRYVDDVQ